MLEGMLLTHLLAQVLGLYMVITSVIMVARKRLYENFINSIDPNSPGLVVGASLWLIFGLFLVVLHNHWVWEWTIILTIVAWVVLIKAILWLSFPHAILRATKKCYHGFWFYLIQLIVFVAGALLMATGFHWYI